jgi:hypothetical protein
MALNVTGIVEKPKPGRQKGSTKPANSGRPKGMRNRATLEKELALATAVRDAFITLTDEQIDKITPLEVMAICTRTAIRSGNWQLAFSAAQAWAPYVHAKLAPRMVDSPEESQVTILGGLPTAPLDDEEEAGEVETTDGTSTDEIL